MTNNRDDYPSLFRNDGGNANHWLEILLIGIEIESRRHRGVAEVDCGRDRARGAG